MATDSIKESVIKNYGLLAKSTNKGILSKLFGCCESTHGAQELAERIGYSERELAAAPQQSNLGLGCGNPTAFVELKKGQAIVDLGSGAGFDAFVVSPLVGDTGKVIGVDLSDDMLMLARKHAKKGDYQNVEFVKGDIEQLPLQDGVADLIISNCVINLSQDKAQVFREAYRVLKQGGKLSISDIVLERELPDFIVDSIAGHVACLSGAEKLSNYMDYITAAGFEQIRIESKRAFPLELILMDPQLRTLAKKLDLGLDSDEVKDLASRVKSISLTASKV